MHLDVDIICKPRHLASDYHQNGENIYQDHIMADGFVKILDVESASVGHDNAV